MTLTNQGKNLKNIVKKDPNHNNDEYLMHCANFY